jgi:hypothetical protein
VRHGDRFAVSGGRYDEANPAPRDAREQLHNPRTGDRLERFVLQDHASRASIVLNLARGVRVPRLLSAAATGQMTP